MKPNCQPRNKLTVWVSRAPVTPLAWAKGRLTSPRRAQWESGRGGQEFLTPNTARLGMPIYSNRNSYEIQWNKETDHSSFREKNFTNVYDSNFTAVNVISHFRSKPAHAGYKVRNSENIRETDIWKSVKQIWELRPPLRLRSGVIMCNDEEMNIYSKWKLK